MTDADVLTTIDSKNAGERISASEVNVGVASHNDSSANVVSGVVLTSANDASVEESKALIEKLRNKKDELETRLIETQVTISYH